jgi:type IV pilus assembly protein PilA
MRQSIRGFTFIELLIVISIIAFLAAVAIPAYSDYLTRSKMAEAILLSLPVKKAVVDYYGYYGSFPADNHQAGIVSAEQLRGNHVAAILVAHGQIKVKLFEIKGELEITPIIEDEYPGTLTWHCGSHTIQSAYLPSTCK